MDEHRRRRRRRDEAAGSDTDETQHESVREAVRDEERARARDDEREMSAFDAWLFRGDENPRTRSMLIAVCPLQGTPDRERVVATLDRASRIIIRLRQKVVAPPIPMLLPAWIVDPDFDLSYHIRFHRLHAPGSPQALLGIVQREAMRKLDESRPLWEVTIVEGLNGDHAAVVLKISHAFADGVGALKLFAELFHASPDADLGPLPPTPVPEDVTPDDLLREALRRTPHATLQGAKLAGLVALGTSKFLVQNPSGSVQSVRKIVKSLERVFGDLAQPSPLLRGRSLSRGAISFDVAVADLKKAAKAAGGSLNDAYLAGIGGTLRRYHLAMDAEVPELPLAMPVNLRRGHEAATGNYFGAMLFGMPLHVEDPAERIAALRAIVQGRRQEPAIAAPAWLAPLMARLPTELRDGLAAKLGSPDIQASNIMGSPTPVYFAGCRVAGSYAFGPVPNIAAMFTLQSFVGTCNVGITYDPAAIVEPKLFAECLEAGFGEVLRLGHRRASITEPVLGRALRPKAAA
jgi:diacylglycerol O-acyltransferase